MNNELSESGSETTAKRESDAESHFDVVSLNDNTHNDCNIKDDKSDETDDRVNDDDNDENVVHTMTENNKRWSDSTPIDTPLCSTPSSEQLFIDCDLIQQLKDRNGMIYDAKLFEEKYENKIIELQSERNAMQNEIEELKRKVSEQEVVFNEHKMRSNANVDKISKQNDASRKELEGMVIKYATSEREVIQLKKVKEDIEKKLRDSIKDKDSLMVRIKGLSNEKQQLMSSLDKKVVDISSLQRDFDKLREELKDRDAKWKQSQSKVKEESNVRIEVERKLDIAMQKICELTEESNELRKEYKRLLHSNESESNAQNDDYSSKIDSLKSETESYKSKITNFADENHKMTTKIQSLERERLDYEQSVSKLKDTINALQIEITDYVAKLKDYEQLKLQLESERELVSALQKESERLNAANNELRAEMESCRHKEGELLEFTERLTAKTVTLQSEHNSLDQKCSALKEEVDKLRKRCDEFNKENTTHKETIDQMKESHVKEVTLLAKKLAEKTKLSDDSKNKIDELENEIRVNKRRHVTTIKELNKELHAMKKRLENYEGQTLNAPQSDTVSMSSRTSSSTSLDAMSANHTNNITSFANHLQPSQHRNQYNSQTDNNSDADKQTTNNYPEVDKQVLIERILRLQKSLAKRNEKIDFLDEHNQHLLEEMKKKCKLIQYYIMREESGALATAKMDDNKRQLAKRGGTIMSSLYNPQINDSAMTLELSLEINSKLQAVLEDTILKNITLKENINTLGDEIARLTQSKSQ